MKNELGKRETNNCSFISGRKEENKESVNPTGGLAIKVEGNVSLSLSRGKERENIIGARKLGFYVKTLRIPKLGKWKIYFRDFDGESLIFISLFVLTLRARVLHYVEDFGRGIVLFEEANDVL